MERWGSNACPYPQAGRGDIDTSPVCRLPAIRRAAPTCRVGSAAMRTAGALAQKQLTLLGALLRERHLTREQTIDLLDRRAREMQVRDFALSVRQLNRWLAGGVVTEPRPSVCRVVEAEFGHGIDELLAPDRGARAARSLPGSAGEPDPRLRTVEFVAWVADHSSASFEEVYAAVAAGVERIGSERFLDVAARQHRRERIGRSEVVEALAARYGPDAGFYRAVVGGTNVILSVIARSGWTGLGVPLASEETRVEVQRTGGEVFLADAAVTAAVNRLAEVETNGTVLVNRPLYRLLDAQVDNRRLAAAFGLTDFASYALTADLLEEELLDSITSGDGNLPLRDLYLPTVEAALSFDGRVCAGGPACLIAIARPEGDYALLIQERSRTVVNVAGRIAVIPKAFHQPTVDAFSEFRVAMTVERELEEELLGRLDLELLTPDSDRRASPTHLLNQSEPMGWLRSHPESYRIECSGFGINMVTGNYEFACLVAVEDPRWWQTYGHRIEGNWEALRLRCVSSRDTAGIAALVGDARWSNEGLFAFIEGLRRLAALESHRVAIPAIEVPGT